MTTAAQVDEVALRIVLDKVISADADTLYRSWQAWGMWANGGFEAILTGGLGDERVDILDALARAGGSAERSLFAAAFELVPEHMNIDERNDFWAARPEVRRKARELDEAMSQLPDFTETVLGRFIDGSESLRSLLA